MFAIRVYPRNLFTITKSFQKSAFLIASLFLTVLLSGEADRKRFSLESDLLLAQFDCKTDVDDLHSVAAFATILSSDDYSELRYHAVAGSYGIQGGLYVPANELFALAFEDNWSDAHADFDQALGEVCELVWETLSNGGDVWIAECGQSDFTAAMLRKTSTQHPEIDLGARIHVVQHSNWNQESTSPESLSYVRETAAYQKIPDGNATGNGTAGLRSDQPVDWAQYVEDPELKETWDTAIEIADNYNGKEARYLNESIAKGGLDFSDTVEIIWILGVDGIEDSDEFFQTFTK